MLNVTADTLEQAIIFAIKAHKGQRRKGNGRPYIMHPLSVMKTLYDLKESKNIFLLTTAAILHDTVEDCGITIAIIAKKFGYHVASLVEELTLDKEKYKTIGKKEYLAEEVLHMSSYALCIKLCDRYDNICDMKQMKPEFIQKYKEETEYILDKLKSKRPKLTKTHDKLINLIINELEKY